MAESATIRRAKHCSFRELTVWQPSMDLVIEVEQIAMRLPAHERFALGRDLRRTVRSIPCNIAEGFNRRSRAAYRLHISIALGSQAELETQVELAARLGYVASGEFPALHEKVAAVGRMLQGLWKALAEPQ